MARSLAYLRPVPPYFQIFGKRLMVFGAGCLLIGAVGWLAGWLVPVIFFAMPALVTGAAMTFWPGAARIDAGFEPNWMATGVRTKLLWLLAMSVGVVLMFVQLAFALTPRE